ncbi:MAG TPA: hypothetical protein VLL75_17875 [Vicinamibacteria bacterium]|jgi:hypothetical protein|nr:hypothetical protein [Vicinamibacteria bacterium]
MTASHVRLRTAHSLRTAVVPVGTVFRRRAGAARAGSSRHGREWAADERAAEDDRLRLVAALLVIATLLVWILFLQG